MSGLHKCGNLQIGVIVTARVKSSRLKHKVLQEVNGRPLIEILLDHVIPADDAYEVILAIPESKDCDILEEIGIKKGVQVWRGEDDSPLHRIYAVAKDYDFDHIVRITADDPLIDQTLMRQQITFHVNGNLDYTFMKRVPEGTAGEVIRVSCLEKVIDQVKDKPVEFVSYYLKQKSFRVKEAYVPYEYQFPIRLTIDYPEDLTLLRLLYAVLPNGFGTLDFINYFKQHKYFLQINHMPEVTIYTCNYNTSDYIIKCIDSILNQSFKDFEFVILDDNSIDNSMNIITEKYSQLNSDEQNKVKILRNSENIGLPASCNKILSMAKGAYIIRVDSDDFIEKNLISRMIEDIKINQVQAVFSGYNRVDEKDNVIDTINDNEFHPACCLLSKWAVNELKYKECLKYAEGKDFFDRFKKQYQYSFINENLWNYRKREGQKTQNKEHPDNK